LIEQDPVYHGNLINSKPGIPPVLNKGDIIMAYQKTVFTTALVLSLAGSSIAMAGGMGGMMGGQGDCPGQGGMGMKMMDTDSDKKVSKDEFMKHHENMFTQMDKNKDGAMDESEMGGMGMEGCMKMMEHGQGGGAQMQHGQPETK
jgi:hypothetical protein